MTAPRHKSRASTLADCGVVRASADVSMVAVVGTAVMFVLLIDAGQGRAGRAGARSGAGL
jgi:hypothetical protein